MHVRTCVRQSARKLVWLKFRPFATISTNHKTVLRSQQFSYFVIVWNSSKFLSHCLSGRLTYVCKYPRAQVRSSQLIFYCLKELFPSQINTYSILYLLFLQNHKCLFASAFCWRVYVAWQTLYVCMPNENRELVYNDHFEVTIPV